MKARSTKLRKPLRRRPQVPTTPKQMREAYLRRNHIAHRNHVVFGDSHPKEPVRVPHAEAHFSQPPPHHPEQPHLPRQSHIVPIPKSHPPPQRVSHNHNSRPKFPVHPGIKYGPEAIPR